LRRSDPPAVDEFEISVIGPGRGECVIVHLGDNHWCVVDSCVPRRLAEPVAIEYLNSFQNGALAGVELIVATHWHDDHIRGLASIVSKVPTASFFCSNALNTDNFFALAETASATIQGASGVEEFSAILGIITDNASTRQARRLASPKWVVENRSLVRSIQPSRSFPVTITALSPSDGTVRRAYQEIANLLPRAGEAQRRIPSISPNHTSIVLWIEAGPLRALLGADLEHTGNPGDGWMAVVGCHQSHRESQRASFIKVPHHGSANGDYPSVWTRMLTPDPLAVVTPFNAGANRLPLPSDLERLAGRTNNLYCTAPGPGKVPTRDSVVEKTMRSQLAGRRVIDGQPGHVRTRWSVNVENPQATVEVFHGAYRV